MALRASANRRWQLIAVLVAAVVLAAAAVIVVVARGDHAGLTGKATIPTTTVATTTTAPSTPTTTSTPVDTSTAVWPAATSATRYTDPVGAASGFAVDFLHFTDPVLGEFRQGDVNSGEIAIRPKPNGPDTVVLVRQLGGTWWVLGAVGADIQIAVPAALDSVSSPVRLQGTSTAFEGTVQVDVREDGNTEPLGRGYVTGGSMGEMRAFEGTVAFDQPHAGYGAIVLYTVSMENGQVWEASVIRVRFAAASATADMR